MKLTVRSPRTSRYVALIRLVLYLNLINLWSWFHFSLYHSDGYRDKIVIVLFFFFSNISLWVYHHTNRNKALLCYGSQPAEMT